MDVIEDGRLADGPAVREFEAAFSDYCEATHGVAVANGTAALTTALRAIGIGPGDVVVTTPLSFVATANAVRLVGATPVFADVDPERYTLDPAAVRATIEDCGGEVDCLLPVHLYGLPAPMDELGAIAEEYDVPIVEDAAQAHGAELDGRRVGSLGDVACFSFYPTKNATTGEGGMIVTDDEDVADRARRYLNHGRTDSHVHESVGHNLRMTSIAAAIGGAQLRRLPRYTAARRRAAERYTEALEATPSVLAPIEPAGARHVYHQYTVRTPDRDGFRNYLESNGVDTGVYYPTPIHRQPAYDRAAILPVAEQATEEVCSIPVHPGLSAAEVEQIATLLGEYEP
ncbi:putative PLP-dependent enzyme possibly involved in cell wall biogenesis [Salinarchaeum sp. Harcht-Bsk1]|nr:putative PLP-dependent enzyme possibly involved in cell wall biogenesis [Salinarchaeum sp. Harcht-Bsk1]